MTRDLPNTPFQKRFTYGGEYPTEVIIDAILELFPQGEQQIPGNLSGGIWEPPLPELKALEGFDKKHPVLFSGLGSIIIKETIEAEVQKMIEDNSIGRERYVERAYPGNQQERERCLREM